MQLAETIAHKTKLILFRQCTLHLLKINVFGGDDKLKVFFLKNHRLFSNF